MKYLYWFAGIIGVAQILVILWIITSPYTIDGHKTRFESASRCVEYINNYPLTSAGIASLIDTPPITPTDCWKPVSMPEHDLTEYTVVDINNPQLKRIWYRVQYPVPEDWPINKQLMIYVPGSMASAWQIRVNDEAIQDNRLEWRSTWTRPISAVFFAKQSGLINIDIGLIESIADVHSISRITVGDATVVRSQKAVYEYFQVTMPQASSAVILILGVFFLSFWLSRRSESEYLLLALANLINCILNLKFVLTQPESSMAYDWYNALIYNGADVWQNGIIYLFATRYARFSVLWWEVVLWIYIIAGNTSDLPVFTSIYDFTLLRGVFDFIIYIGTTFIIFWQAFKKNNSGLKAIALALVIGVFLGLNDMAITTGLISHEMIFLGPHFGLVLSAAFLFAIQRRYLAALQNQEQANIALARQIEQRDLLTQQLQAQEAELRANQQRILEYERSQTLAEERQRLMHDMHDGLGASLLTTLSAVEKKQLPQSAVADALRTCIDDLRLIIDSLEPTANDLATLLGTIRYRLGQRLVSAGIELQWQIADLPPVPWLEPPDALQVLRLIQEALVNILKHADADSVCVLARQVGEQIEIKITDNGVGYDLNAITLGRGLLSQAKRAKRLGGVLVTESAVGLGSSLSLSLPLNKLPSVGPERAVEL